MNVTRCPKFSLAILSSPPPPQVIILVNSWYVGGGVEDSGPHYLSLQCPDRASKAYLKLQSLISKYVHLYLLSMFLNNPNIIRYKHFKKCEGLYIYIISTKHKSPH